jgi:hypothetical protein
VTQVLPSYQAALSVPTIPQEEAALLSMMGASPLPLGTTIPGALTVTGSVFTLVNHGLSSGDAVRLWAVGPGAALPQPLASLTAYYVVASTANTFQLAAAIGGAALALTPGSGLFYGAKITASSLLAGWPPDAPQRQLLTAEAQAIQFEQIQRAALAYASSPQQVRQLRAFLIGQGYSATDAATITSAWVDVVLEWYQSPRVPAAAAVWSISMASTTVLTIDASSNIVIQGGDGSLFVSAQPSPVVLNAASNFQGQVIFAARLPGSAGNGVVAAGQGAIVQGPAGLNFTDDPTVFLVSPGRDAESDEDALTRAQGRWGTLSSVLTASGWLFVLATPEVGGVPTITRVFVDDANPFGPGSVGIALANAAGAALPSEVAAAQAQAAKYTIAGMGPVVLSSAAELDVPVIAVLKTDGTNPNAAAQGAAALATLGPALAGNTLYLDAIIAALMGVAGVDNVASLSLTTDVQRPSAGVIVLQPSITAT